MKTVLVPCTDDSPLAGESWLVQPMAQGEGVHILREAEQTLHELDRGCWCKPTVEMRDPSTERPHREPIFIHRATQFDART